MSVVDPGESAHPLTPTGRAEPAVAQVPAPGASRLLYMDTLRSTLMLLGVAYHTLGVFSARRGEVAGGWAGWDVLKEFTHVRRMPAFFVVAGVFAAMVLTRRGSGPGGGAAWCGSGCRCSSEPWW